MARVLIGVNVLALAAAVYSAPAWAQALSEFVGGAAFLEPLLLASLVLLYGLAPLFARLPYWWGCAAVLGLISLLASVAYAVWPGSADPGAPGLARTVVLTAIVVTLVLGYLRLLVKAHSPALAEARLQALQARIRPHFLFNSLNAVLALIRRDPKRAERTLEDLADLFRTLMSDGRKFVRLADEISLLERYASIEQLRLGKRLRVVWELDTAPPDALLPPLLLQPLLENAIYHGIEPGTGAGEVLIRIERRGGRVLARIENPYFPEHQHRAGNRMALANIGERLQLFFDAEAGVETSVEGERFVVQVELPYRSREMGRE